MKRVMTTLGALMTWATPAMAGGGTETTGTSLITILFFGFAALIVVGQLIPSMVIFCGMVKGVFGETARKPL
jgi:hypothetical protein